MAAMVFDSLGATTAYGEGHRYKEGSNSSPIRVDRNNNFTVDGTTYTPPPSAAGMVERILRGAELELTKRRQARTEAKYAA